MAFNPFAGMRKLLKPMMAVLAVLCMLVFVLSSGLGNGGDLLDQLPRMLSGGPRGPEVVRVAGTPVDADGLDRLRFERRAAERYVSELANSAISNLLGELNTEGLKTLSDEIRATLRPVVAQRLALASGNEQNRRFSLFQYGESLRQNLPRLRGMLAQKRAEMADTSKTPSATLQADITALDSIVRVMEHDQGFRFLSLPNDNSRHAADFKVWHAKARALGIDLQEPEVEAELMHDLIERRPDPAFRGNLARFLAVAEFPGVTPESLLATIKQEYETRIALAAVFGQTFPNRTDTTSPAFAPPHELFQFYREACSQTGYFGYSLPVSAFLKDVAGTPPEAELRALYEKYKGVEPATGSETPGFKRPRRIAVAWLGGAADAPYYRERAPLLLGARLAGTQVGTALSAPAAGPLGGPLTLAASLALADAPLLGQYDEYLSRRLPWTDAITPRLRDTSTSTPEAVAHVTAGVFAALGSGAPVAGAALSAEAAAIDAEVQARARVGVPLVLAPFGPVALTAAAPALLSIPADLPFAAVKPGFRRKLLDESLVTLLQADLNTFEAELYRLRKDRAAIIAEDYFETFAKARGLQSGRMDPSAPKDKSAVADDPALAPLKGVFTAGHGGSPLSGAATFGEFFFAGDGFNFPGAPTPPAEDYKPRWYPNGFPPSNALPSQKLYLTWRVADEPARQQSFEESRKDVEAAWRLDKARALAAGAADKLAVEAKALNGDKAKLRDLGERVKRERGGNWFEMPNVARLVQLPALAPETPPVFSAYTLPADVTSPRPDTAARLLAVRDREVGTPVSFTNVPADTRYLALVVGRAAKTEADFFEVFPQVARTDGGSTELTRLFHRRKLDELYRAVTTQVRAAVGYSEDGVALDAAVRDETKNAAEER